MALKAYTFRFDPDLIARVDGARGDVNRTRWVQRALESALAEGPTLPVPPLSPETVAHIKDTYSSDSLAGQLLPEEPVATVLGAKVRKSRKTPSLKDTWGR